MANPIAAALEEVHVPREKEKGIEDEKEKEKGTGKGKQHHLQLHVVVYKVVKITLNCIKFFIHFIKKKMYFFPRFGWCSYKQQSNEYCR